MGADSSTLQSIESLNSTLEDIEKKLFIIEDVHLHHERTISHDDSVLISGKKIGCRSGVRLICGPVIGVIGSNFARVLVEVDTDSELTFNVFVTDAQLICTRYSFAVSINARAGIPVAIKIEHLDPRTNYTVYIGGVTPSETVTNYATFQTLPEDASAVRVVLAHNGRVDKLMPGETNLWKEIENRVVSATSTLPTYYDELISAADESNGEPSATSSSSSSAALPPVHLMCHHGNLISIEPILRGRAVELLDLLTREDANYSEWEAVLQRTEGQIREAFRSALTAPSLRNILRKCGNIFLVGPEESGAITTALLALNLPADKLAPRAAPPGPSSSIGAFSSKDREGHLTPSAGGLSTSASGVGFNLEGNDDDDDADGDDSGMEGGASSSSRKGGGAAPGSSPSVDSSRNTSASGKRKQLKKGKSKKGLAAAGSKTVPIDVVVDEMRRGMVPVAEDADTAADIDLTPVIGGTMRRFYDAEQLSMKSKAVVQENLRRLLAGLLARSIR